MRKLILAAALAAVSVAVATSWAFAANGGNSTAAHACQQGGYASLVGGTPDVPDPSVTFDNADTTTTGSRSAGGCRSICCRTIEITRRMAASSATDVPPNFITTLIGIPRANQL